MRRRTHSREPRKRTEDAPRRSHQRLVSRLVRKVMSRRKPTREGFYWWRKSESHAPTIAWVGKYALGPGWCMHLFWHNDDHDPVKVGQVRSERWGKMIREPQDG